MRTLLFTLVFCLTFALVAHAANQAELDFKTRCSSCHGANGDGNGHAQMKIKPQDLRSPAVQKKSDSELFNSIANGIPHSEYPHAFSKRGLTPEQIKELVAYIRTLAPSKKN